LGQLGAAVEVLFGAGAIDLVQALLLLAALLSLNQLRSNFLLYEHSVSQRVYQALLGEALRSAEEGSARELRLLAEVFLPTAGRLLADPAPFYLELTTISLPLFQQAASTSLRAFWQPLGLTFQNVPACAETLLHSHGCYAYCAQLLLSLCVELG
jgi:hypothetical protein